MSPRVLFLALASFLLFSVSTHADTVELVPGGAAFDDPLTGLSMSPYTAVVNGQTTDVFCVDFSSSVSNDANWTATATALVSPSGYANTLQYQMTMDNSTAQNNYLEMAWLILQLQSALAVDNLTAAAKDQWAIWSFSGGTNPYGTDAGLLAEAQAAVSDKFSVNGWEILTPDAGQHGQEFILETALEPSTMLLLLAGLGLAVIVGLYRNVLPA